MELDRAKMKLALVFRDDYNALISTIYSAKGLLLFCHMPCHTLPLVVN